MYSFFYFRLTWNETWVDVHIETDLKMATILYPTFLLLTIIR